MSSRRMDAYTIALAVAAATLLWLLFVIKAHADDCISCMPVAPEPPPPISSARSGAVYLPMLAGGDEQAVGPASVDVPSRNRLWLPLVAVTDVTGEGGSGILPVRGK